MFNEIKLEDIYQDTGFEEGRFETWQSDFMARANITVTEVEKELNGDEKKEEDKKNKDES